MIQRRLTSPHAHVGDFEETCRAESTYPLEPQAGLREAVLTCFFINTADDVFPSCLTPRKLKVTSQTNLTTDTDKFQCPLQAKNIVNYLRIIHKIPAPAVDGLTWVSPFPLRYIDLLWHWENNTTEDSSIERSLDEVKDLARGVLGCYFCACFFSASVLFRCVLFTPPLSWIPRFPTRLASPPAISPSSLSTCHFLP
jgi:hypothetical protein